MHFEKKGIDPTRLHKQAGEQACRIPGVLPPAASPLPIQRRKSSFSKEIQHRKLPLCNNPEGDLSVYTHVLAPRAILMSSIEAVKLSSTQKPPIGGEGSRGQH